MTRAGPDPYTVGPETPIDQVVAEMARHKYGSVVVIDNHHVVGVFTTHEYRVPRFWPDTRTRLASRSRWSAART